MTKENKGKDKDDDDGAYTPVVGFFVPIKRVLGMDERPESADGTRHGSMFLTMEGCTFECDGIKGDAAGCVGAPSVVISIGDADSSVERGNRYIVDIKDMIETAITAHKAREAGASPSDHVLRPEEWRTVIALTEDDCARLEGQGRPSAHTLRNMRQLLDKLRRLSGLEGE